MAPLASMLTRVACQGCVRSRLALPAAASLSPAVRSADACGDLILGSRLAALRPKINLTGDAFNRQLFGCAELAHRSFCTNSSSTGTKNLYNEFFAEVEDMESDDALWALYHRWCKHHKVQRDHDEMVRRFDEFKNCVHYVYRVNSSGGDLRLSLNKNFDIPLTEMYGTTPMISEEAHARLKALGGLTIEFGPRTDD